MIKDVGDRTPEKAIWEARERINYDTREYPLEVIMSKYNPKTEEEAEIYVPNICWGWDEWTEVKQSKFVESVLIGAPLANIVLGDEENTARLEVIDGKQRLNALSSFIDNKLTLVEMNILKELNGTTYKDLHPPRQRRFNRTTFRVVILDPSVDKEMREHIKECMSSHSLVH